MALHKPPFRVFRPTRGGKPSRYWMVEFTHHDGSRKRISTQQEAHAAALEAAATIYADSQAGLHDLGTGRAKQAGMTLRQMFDRCFDDPEAWRNRTGKAAKNLISIADCICRELGADTLITSLNRDKLKTYAYGLIDAGLSPGTASNRIAMIRAAMRHALEWTDGAGRRVLTALPGVVRIEVTNHQPRVLTYEEERLIHRSCRGHYKATGSNQWWLFERMWKLGVITGARRGELLALKWDGVFTTQLRLMTLKQKGAGLVERMIPLMDEARPVLLELRQRFGPHEGWDGPFAALTVNNCSGMLDRLFRRCPEHRGTTQAPPADCDICAAADIQGVKFHTTRHTCVTRMLEHGAELGLVAMYVGHADVNLTRKRYAHVSMQSMGEQLRAVMARERPALLTPVPTSVPDADKNH